MISAVAFSVLLQPPLESRLLEHRMYATELRREIDNPPPRPTYDFEKLYAQSLQRKEPLLLTYPPLILSLQQTTKKKRKESLATTIQFYWSMIFGR